MFFEENKVFGSDGRSNYRIPSLIVTNEGNVLAFCSNRLETVEDHADEIDLVYAIKRPGESFSEVRTLVHRDGWISNIGCAVYDDTVGCAIIFFRRKPVARDEFKKYTEAELSQLEMKRLETLKIAEKDGITEGSFVLVSEDGGETFTESKTDVTPTFFEHIDGTSIMLEDNTHGASHGIRLRHGKYAGRLLCPARTVVGEYNDWIEIRKHVYNNAIYSDDHGKSWRVSKPVQIGTGEGTLIERADGSILYNSRAYFADGKRYMAVSRNGGESYGEFYTHAFLREETHIGCNASFLRVELDDIADKSALPEDALDLTVFCNPRADSRRRMTLCVSFDSGENFREAQVVFEGQCAYSSLDYDKKSGHFFLLYERGSEKDEYNPYAEGLYVAEFDIEWLLGKKS